MASCSNMYAYFFRFLFFSYCEYFGGECVFISYYSDDLIWQQQLLFMKVPSVIRRFMETFKYDYI